MEALKSLGIGLSRLLRYSYGGFLLITFMTIFAPRTTTAWREALSWELAAITAVVLGAGIYTIHRAVVVPVHHGLLCLCWLVVDRWRDVARDASGSPTRWLASLEVPFVWRISAYSILRGSTIFESERTSWDIAHAEWGLILMTTEAFAVAALCAYYLPDPPLPWRPLTVATAVLFILSFSGFTQHAIECRRFKEKRDDVVAVLRSLGLVR